MIFLQLGIIRTTTIKIILDVVAIVARKDAQSTNPHGRCHSQFWFLVTLTI